MAKLISELSKGAWSSLVTYTAGDIIDSNGSSYICIATTVNNAPPNGTYWALLASKGAKGDTGDPGVQEVTLVGVETLTNKTLITPVVTAPKITTSINDANNNEVLKVPATTDAVNEVTVTNAPTGDNPELAATGDDTNLALRLKGKGASVQAVGQFNNGNSGASKVIDWGKGDRQKVTIDTDACSFSFTGAVAGQTLTLLVVEDGTGHTAPTWPTLKWPNGNPGTPIITASAINLYIFYFDGTNYLAQLAQGFA